MISYAGEKHGEYISIYTSRARALCVTGLRYSSAEDTGRNFVSSSGSHTSRILIQIPLTYSAVFSRYMHKKVSVNGGSSTEGSI